MKAIKTAWTNIKRSPYQTLAATTIMMLTFLALTIFSFIILGSSEVISYFESKPQVTAFFKEDTQQENIDALQSELESNSKVAEIKYVSKKEALEIYKEQNKDDPLLLELVTEDILPASLEISAVNIEDLEGISETLKDSPYVQEVIFQRDVVSTLTQWTSAIRR